MIQFLDIYLANAERIIYFPVFALGMFFVIKNYLRIKKAHKILVHQDNNKQIFKHFSGTKQRIKTICLCLSLFFLFIALLRPQWTKKDKSVVQEGRDLLIVLDISRSMLAQDLKPNRLEFAKLKIRALLAKLKFERVGLILFSGSAFLQSPLTADYDAFLMFLNQVDTEVISSGTTAIDDALLKAIDVFKESPDRKNKLVLLISDGEDFSLELDAVKQQSTEFGIRLFALGVGSPEGAPIPKIDRVGNQIGHETDEAGAVALSKLNEQLLHDICTQLNGHYFRAQYQDSDLDDLVSLIKSFEKEKFTDTKLSMYEDQYPWFLGIAWILLLLEWVL